MKRGSLFFMIGLIGILLSGNVRAQGDKEFIQLIDNQLKLTISLNWDQQKIEEIAKSFQVDSVWVQAILSRDLSRQPIDSHWILKHSDQQVVVLVKTLGDSAMDGGDYLLEDNVLNESKKVHQPKATFGYNPLNLSSVTELPDGRTCFLWNGRRKAGKVYLSGTFNGWSTLSHPMKKTERGWEMELELKPGKQLYKFIVDGQWMSDSENQHWERDEFGGRNSLYFKPNTYFRLGGYPKAKKVYLAGTFNNWNSRDCRMQKRGDTWEAAVYLQEGTYGYKFVVDGQWIVDPANPDLRKDAYGNENSFLSFGPTHRFHLQGYTDAGNVVLAGSFNRWSQNEFLMEKTVDGWQMDIVLPAGQYEYKFIVDGRWMPDPQNPLAVGEGDFVNSLLFIEPNTRFYLPGHESSHRVTLSGSFNGWAQPGYPLVREPGGWSIDLYLEPGKHLYKYIIDGEHVIDPVNPYSEPNEFGTGNSIIWVEGR